MIICRQLQTDLLRLGQLSDQLTEAPVSARPFFSAAESQTEMLKDKKLCNSLASLSTLEFSYNFRGKVLNFQNGRSENVCVKVAKCGCKIEIQLFLWL